MVFLIPSTTIAASPESLQQNNAIAPTSAVISDAGPKGATSDHPQLKTITIREGDNLASIFTRIGLTQHQLQSIMNSQQVDTPLNKLQPAEHLQVLISRDNKLEQLNCPINLSESLVVNRNENGSYTATIIHHPPERKLKTASGKIERSFAKDAIKLKLYPKQVKQFMDIFDNDIDFKRESKKGDTFKVVYETYFIDDKEIGSGDIVAAEYTMTTGKTFHAVQYIDPEGKKSYYTPTGENLQQAFIRKPLMDSFVSSAFAQSRLDPVAQQYVRPHKGVDFAAPMGTPIQASGDGKIIFAGIKNGYGNTIIIQHTPKYRSLYAHMMRFASGIRQGTMIKGGQLIGYVGVSGRVTGPHLHYEFSENGVQRNPLTVNLPRARAIAAAYREEFIEKAKHLIAMLTSSDDTASSESKAPSGPTTSTIRLAENKQQQQEDKK